MSIYMKVPFTNGSAEHEHHIGWIVLDSIRSIDGHWCVDVFERPAGGFGFEHFRSEPEDVGRWTAVGGFAGRTFDIGADYGTQVDPRYEGSPFKFEGELDRVIITLTD